MRSVTDRKGIIGGSDMGSLFNLPPYGCRRKLYYNFIGEGEEIEYDNSDMKRGRELEDYVAYRFKQTHPDFRVRKKKKEYRHPELPLIGHVDRLFYGEKIEGVLEIKVPRTVFTKLPDSYFLQLQLYLGLSGKKVGIFADLFIEEFVYKEFKIVYDKEIFSMIEDETINFLDKVEEVKKGANIDVVFPKLSVEDNRCQTCPFAEKCWGSEIEKYREKEKQVVSVNNQEIVKAYSKYIEAGEIKSEADKLYKASKSILIDFMIENEVKNLLVHGEDKYIRLEYQETEGIDKEKLKREFPEVYEKVKKKSGYWMLRKLKVKDNPIIDFNEIKPLQEVKKDG